MDEGAVSLIGLILFLLILILNIIFYGFHSALDNFNSAHLEDLENEDQKQKIEFFLNHDLNFRRTFQTMISGTNILLGILAVRICGQFFLKKIPTANLWAHLGIYLLLLFCATFLLMLIGVLIPQKVASRKAKKWTCSLIGLVYGFYCLVKPFVSFVNGIANVIVPIFGVDPNQAIDDVTEEEIISMVNEGHEQGTILESEAEMIHNIFDFDDKDAQDIMTRRKNIVALDGEMQFEEALDFMLNENFSRFPVYTEDIDHVIGIIHIKDAMLIARKTELLAKQIREIPELMRDVLFIPETQNINVLFKTMQKNKVHMVVVIDEYGQTSGIAAMEDILEEIVGDIEDEHDEEVAMIVKQGNGTFLLNGMADLEDVEDALGIETDFEDIDTLNGLLVSLIDKIPEDDECFEVTYGGYLFRILSVGNKTIKTVLATKIDQPVEEKKIDEK